MKTQQVKWKWISPNHLRYKLIPTVTSWCSPPHNNVPQVTLTHDNTKKWQSILFLRASTITYHAYVIMIPPSICSVAQSRLLANIFDLPTNTQLPCPIQNLFLHYRVCHSSRQAMDRFWHQEQWAWGSVVSWWHTREALSLMTICLSDVSHHISHCSFWHVWIRQ